MYNEFNSKVVVQTKSSIGMKVLKILATISAVTIILCLIIKIICNDFKFSDISNIFYTLFFMYFASRKVPQKSIFGFGKCTLSFDNDKMIICYLDIDSGTNKGHFKETSIIKYADIECIQYSKELECFGIVANADTKREYFDANFEKHVADPDITSKTFLFILDSDKQSEVIENMQRYTGIEVEVVE